jgi:pyruvate/2-oxoglutarate dehydrogenase complex dihydrolipoamide dehydrogenase (E3) component
METDVIVIGSGQAGIPLATRFGAAKKRVVLIERAELGGTCVNTGCTPTKTMVASARAAHIARTAARLGVHAQAVSVDFPAVVARKDAIVERWREGIRRRLAAVAEWVQVVHADARFVAPHEVEAGGQRYRAPIVIVNTGASAAVPAIPGLDQVDYLDNRTVMSLPALPRHLLIAGGGYIGCEFGQMFRRFGAEVTIIDHNPHLLSREDADTSSALEDVFRAEGVRLALGSRVARVKKSGPELLLELAGGSELSGSHLLVAAGRVPNTRELGCEAAGIALDARGAIEVDDGFETSVAGVYALGDVTGGPQFTHNSWDDHRLLFERLTAGGKRPRSGRIVPSVVFTDPQVARLGLSENQARAQGIAFEVASMPYGSIARAIETDETAGTMKILIDPVSEKILGVTLVGVEAGELLHVFVVLMQADIGPRPIVDAQFVHPTFAEGVQSLVMRLPRYALS